MKKITFDDLCAVVANIDPCFKNTYPISFKVVNTNNINIYHSGIAFSTDHIPIQYIITERTYYKTNTWLSPIDCIDAQDDEVMSFEEIVKALQEKCNINENSKIYFYLNKDTFNGHTFRYDGNFYENDENISALTFTNELTLV